MEHDQGWPNKMLRLPVKETLRKIGHFLFDHIQDEGLSDHFLEHPAPYVRIVQGELEFPPLPVPDIMGRDLPPYDSEGRYLNSNGEEV